MKPFYSGGKISVRCQVDVLMHKFIYHFYVETLNMLIVFMS